MLTATLTSKGQITLPKDVRQQLRVRAGSVDVSALRGLLHGPVDGPSMLSAWTK